MELKAVAGVDRFIAEAAARKDHTNRWLHGAHRSDLPWRRVRAEESTRFTEIERVPEIARRVVFRDVEQLEVCDVVLNLLTFGNGEAE